jgi:hypothetical protein
MLRHLQADFITAQELFACARPIAEVFALSAAGSGDGARSASNDDRRHIPGLQLAEKAESIGVLNGHEFTRADNARDINTALAAEGRSSCAATARHAFFSKLSSRET